MKKYQSISEKLLGSEKLSELKGRARQLKSNYTSDLLDEIRKCKPDLSQAQQALIYNEVR
jgi:hypothetical protein